MTVFNVGVLPRPGLEHGTFGQQTSALTVQPFNAVLKPCLHPLGTLDSSIARLTTPKSEARR